MGGPKFGRVRNSVAYSKRGWIAVGQAWYIVVGEWS